VITAAAAKRGILEVAFHGICSVPDGIEAEGSVIMLLTSALWTLASAGILGNTVLGSLVMCPRCKMISTNLIRLPKTAVDRGEIALTFDDGPDAEVTPQVLDQLDLHGAKASFFCIGEKAAARPDLVAEIIRRGHSVENHSYNHRNLFAFSSSRNLKIEVIATQQVIRSADAGGSPMFFRAPFGFRSPLLGGVLRQTRLQHVAWTRRGYDAVCRNPDAVFRRLAHKLSAGDILLLHDGGSARTRKGQPVVLEVLPRLLEQCASHGLRSVSLPMAFGDAQFL
jgi:peptidoglycan/xylan/chitin deacetylase (PgdA/CDA1 family)